jgi:predicted DCC family thiol-disulfide oxidoreductase YuxK
MDELPKDKKIILFDGVCNLCDASVQYVIKHDKKDVFRFVQLQSELGKKIATHIGVDTTKLDTFIVYDPGIAYYIKSEAAFKVAATLGGFISLLGVFAFLPVRITNLVYNFVANNRYQWYGKKESCMLPTPEVSAKFL